MKHSLFELFKIGIGPSSSHTMGPMRAALRFVEDLQVGGMISDTARIRVDLYGSLALTGLGHGTDGAILLGLSGQTPDGVDPAEIATRLATIRATGQLQIAEHHAIAFDEAGDLLFHRDQMYPVATVVSHPNGMRFSAFDHSGGLLAEQVFFSVGGGFIVTEAERAEGESDGLAAGSDATTVPYPFHSAVELLDRAADADKTIAQVVMANECALLRSAEPEHASHLEGEVARRILHIWQVMRACTQRGMATEGILPGGLKVRRRAAKLAARLRAGVIKDPLAQLDWITVYAMAVNEENAGGGRVVTAPTNGAAGVVPAVAHYYLEFVDGADAAGILRYFLTAAAIGILYKENASISGAEVGCQGEVGVASSMAAGGLVAALHPPGGSLAAVEINARIEHAAEIGMEHHLGMTCDPIGGLVQVPCIERNAVGAIKAVNASRMAMYESEGHKVSLDQVIKTMYETGLDMQARYKETSLAGLALNVIEC